MAPRSRALSTLPGGPARPPACTQAWRGPRTGVVCATFAPAASVPEQQTVLQASGQQDMPSTSSPSMPLYQMDRSYTRPSIKETGTLRPAAEWYPAWMQYRRREDNYIFWKDKFMRCSLDIPWYEKRWTVFSSLWFLLQEFRFFAIPPAIRFVCYHAWRAVMNVLYECHKLVVLTQCMLDAWVASEASGGKVRTFSRTMALRRLHWKNSVLGEVLYFVNIAKTGRVHLLPPVKRPAQRPTFFWLF